MLVHQQPVGSVRLVTNGLVGLVTSPSEVSFDNLDVAGLRLDA